MRNLLVLFFICLAFVGCSGHTYVKMAMPPRFRENSDQLRLPSCSDVKETNKLALSYTPPVDDPTKDAPWAESQAKVFLSASITISLQDLFQHQVPGLVESFDRVFEIFSDHGCLIYLIGGLVRDELLGSTAKDVDMQFSCPIEKMQRICQQQNWLFHPSVEKENKRQYIQIGTNSSESTPKGDIEPLEGQHWSTNLLDNLTRLEYTTNALYYDIVNHVIIDRTGDGVSDTCRGKIRIPVNRTDWVTWSAADGDYSRIVRYWKLRAKSFTADSFDSLSFIVTTMKQLWFTSRSLISKTTRKFICKTLGDVKCTYCKDETHIEKFISWAIACQNDVGLDWWNKNILPLVPGCAKKKLFTKIDFSSCHKIQVQGPPPDFVSLAKCDDSEIMLSGGGYCEVPGEKLCGGKRKGFLHHNAPFNDNSWITDCYSYEWNKEACSMAEAVCCKKL